MQSGKLEGYRLSPQQKRLWQLDRGGARATYRAECAVEIRGPLERERLKRALDRVVRRHGILRTGCRLLPGMSLPVQFVTDSGVVWRGANGAGGPNGAAFDLEAGRVLQVSLSRLADDRHVLAIALPALCADSRTLDLLVRDLGRCYAAAGSAAEDDEPVSYADLAAWQNELLESDDAATEREFWRRVELPPLEAARLPGENGARGPFEPLRLERVLEPGCVALVDAIDSERGIATGSFLLACWSWLLGRLTGERRVCVATGCDGRTYEELADVLGPLARYLPLVATLDPAERFSALAARIHGAALEAPRWQEYFSWDQLAGPGVEAEAGSRGPLAPPFGYDYLESRPPESAGGLELVIREARVVAERFKIRLACRRDGATLTAAFDWDAGSLVGREVERIAERFVTLAAAAARAPDACLGQLDVIGPAERRELLVEFNRTERDSRVDEPFHVRVARHARAHADRLAVRQGAAELSYGELDARAVRLAHRLRALGVAPGETVGLWCRRTPEMVVGLLAISEAGAAWLPLDPAQPPERLRFMAEDAGVRWIVTERSVEHPFGDGVDLVEVSASDGSPAAPAAEREPVPVHAEGLAYVIYTSGSTGRPKGVMISQRGLTNYLDWCIEAYGLGRGARVPVHSPLGFDLTVTSLLAPLAAGDTVVLLPEQPGIEALEQALGDGGTWGLVKLTPSHLDALAESLRRQPGTLGPTTFVVGGEALHDEQLAFWRARAPGSRFINEYGPTETVVGSVIHEASADAHPGPVPIGRPIANTRVYLLDDDLEPVPWGVAGELYVAGDGLARGYVGRGDLTAERFLPDPYSGVAGARMYRTGDLCRFTLEGALEFRGRADHQVKIRGHRIEPDEIACVLAETPGVRQAAVVVREDRPGHAALVAYVVLEPGALPAGLREALAARLPDYMVPAAFVVLESLPLTSNGKLDRAALPAPEAGRPSSARAYVPASTAAERELASIWAAVLGVERVGVHDNFFELGGDSILAIQVVSRAGRAGLRLSPQQLFQHQTIAELGRVAGRRAAVEAEQGEVTGAVEPTPIVRWWLSRDVGSRAHYNQSVLLSLGERLDAERLGRALSAVVSHHDALRMRCTAAGTLSIAAVSESEPCAVEVVELNGLGLALEQRAAELQESLELERGPIVRLALFETGEAERPQRLLWVVHHLAVDGVSWRILLEDLFTAYGQLSAGAGRVTLPAKTTSYRQWCERLSEHATTEAVSSEAEYWRGVAGGGVVPLPLDHVRGANTTGSSRTIEVRLGAERTRALLQEVPGAYRTRIDEVLLCAVTRALGGWSGGDEVLVELEGHGREELSSDVDVSRTVGWFTTLYPVRLRVEQGAGAGAALKSTKEQLRAVPGRGLGYGLLRWIGGEAGLETAAEVSFNYLGRFEGLLPAGGPVTLAPESAGPPQSGAGLRSHVLEVTGGIDGSGLCLAWTYSEALHERSTIERLAERCAAELEGLIEHCLSSEAGGVTPSDFPLAGLEQAELDRVVGRGREVEDLYPLSPLQSGLLFHTLYAPESGVYFEQIGCTFTGELDGRAFRAAWESAVERHAILRTRFVWEGVREPLQVVERRVELPWREEDWRGLGSAASAERLERLVEEDRRAGFDLARAPLMRFALIRLDEQRWRLVWSHHHLLLDGWSVAALLGEVMASYRAAVAGATLPVETPPPFVRHVEWLGRQDRTSAETFWRGYLAGVAAPTPLGIDRAVPAPREQGSDDHGERSLELGEPETLALERLARERQLTLANVVQTAWALVLHRYSGEDDIVCGATFSGRTAPLDGIETMLGLFINTLPVRTRVDRRRSVAELLRVQQDGLAALQPWEWTPLVEVQGASDVPRGTPLFESLLVFENYPLDRALVHPVAQLEISDVRLSERTNYPLTLIAVPGQRLGFRLAYDRRRFDDDAIERMLVHLCRLLGGIAAGPERPVQDLELLDAAERRRVLVEWNETEPAAAPLRCLHEQVAERARETPEAPAVVCGTSTMSYAELNARANRLARWLGARGVRANVPVAVAVERSPEMIVALLGVLKAGGAYVPLDASYPLARLERMLDECASPVLVTEEHLLVRLPVPRAGEVLCLDRDWPAVAALDPSDPAPAAGLDDLLYVIYTSGSTGRPKGVAMPHRALASLLAWQAGQSHAPGPRTLQFASPSFDVSCQEIFGTLCHGGTLVLITDGERVDPAAVLDLIEREQVARLFLPFVALQQLAEAAAARGGAPACLREVVTAGERLQTTPRIAELFADPSVRVLHNQYGPTETHVVTAHTLDRPSATWPALPPIGRPVAGARVYVLDRDLEPLPPGVPGELYAGGVALARCYLHRPELTAERFVPDPFGAPGDRLYRTGDLCRWLADGTLEFCGRADHQVKLRGFRVEPGEVEAVLCRAAGVREAVAIVREDTAGDRRLVAYVVAEGGRADEAELLRHARRELPEFMVPQTIVVLEELPLSPNGKVDRARLPAPDRSRRALEREYVAPRTGLERRLASIWADVLGVDRVGIHDSFFELGGHSLLAMQLVSRLRESFRLELPLRDVFEASTVAALAAVIERTRQVPAAPPILTVPRDRELALSFAQERQWVLNQLVPDSSFYNLHAAVRLSGPLEPVLLEDCFAEIVRRHEVLRTTFPTVAGRPTLQVARELRLPVVFHDLSGLPPAEREQELTRQALSEVGQPFDLVAGPLLRVTLWHFAGGEHLLLLVMHHIASDGWSLGVLVREVAALYPAFAAGQPSPLGELPIQYADFADWQRRQLAGPALVRQIDYWREQLADLPPLDLPTDRPRPAIQTFRGRRHEFLLDPELAKRLAETGRERGVTPFMTLVATLQLLLGRYAGQADVAIGTPVAGRNRGEVEPLIGVFINTLVLRTDLGGDPTFAELCDRVREVSLGAWAHQELPFEKLVDELQPERDLSRAALFQVMFTLQNLPVEPPALPGGIRLQPVAFDTGAVKFDLTLTMWQDGERLHGTWGYNTDLFEPETIARVDRHFRRLLAAGLAAPEGRISELPLLDPVERKLQLEDWNATTSPVVRAGTVIDLFRDAARAAPHAPALVFRGETVSYGELAARVDRLARRLRACGVGPETRVAVSVERSIDAVTALLGVLAAGGAWVPLDPSNPRDRLAWLLRDAGARVLLTSARLVRSLPEHGAETMLLEESGVSVAGTETLEAPDPRNLAYVIYTSGSTGRPKGVMLEHRGLVNLVACQRAAFDVRAEDRVLQFASLGFDASVSEIFVTLAAGATLVLAPAEEMLPGRALVDLLEGQRITAVTLPPSVLAALPAGRYPDLRTIVSAGEPCSRELVARWSPGRRFINAYGPTENTVCATLTEIASADRTPSIGRPIGNVRVYVLDRHLEPVPIGVAGELYLGGAGLARGYLHNAALTAERFVPDPFAVEAGARLYRTGDVCRWLPDGTLDFLRRADEQVKVRGFRIELGEIEAVLREHPAVREAAAAARPDATGHRRLVAWIVPEPGSDPTTAELVAHLEAYLPQYMVPQAWVRLASLPLLPSGKLDRKALPDPEGPPAGTARPFVAPRTGLERYLAASWAEALGLERVGIHDNFFELGGDSIKGAILINQLQEKLGQYVYTVALFDSPDIANLSRFLATNHGDAVRELFGEESLAGVAVPAAQPIGDADIDRLAALVRAVAPAAGADTGPPNPRAIFVLSPPRSGSTLTRVMLAGHPRLFAPPELLLAGFDTLDERQRALANGRDDFWLEGVVRAVMELCAVGAEEAEAIVDESRRAGATTREFYGRMQSWLGSRTLVDKTPHYALDPGTLERMRSWFDEPRFIHLVRHPAATVASFEEARLHVLFKPFFRSEPPWPPRRLAELIWCVCHRNILDFLATVPAERCFRLRFEELVAQPAAVTEALCAFLGLDPDPGMLEPHRERKSRMTDPVRPMARMLGDIKFHDHDGIDADAADRWRQTAAPDELGDATWELAARLGYERPRPTASGRIVRRSRDTAAEALLDRLHELPPEEVERLLGELGDDPGPAKAG